MTHPDADLHDLLDSSFGDGPEPRPVDTTLTAARRAVRRRRATAAGAGLAAAAVLAVAAWAVSPSPAGPEQLPVATDQTSSPSDPTPTGDPSPTTPSGEVEIVSIRDGEIEVRNGSVDMSVGPLVKGGDEGWVHEVTADNGHRSFVLVVGTAVHVEPARGELIDWALAQGWSLDDGDDDEAAAGGDPAPTGPTSPLVTIDGTTFTARAGVTIVAQQAGLGFPESFSPDPATTAAALVERDGERFYVLHRVLGGQGEFLTVPAADFPPTLPEFLQVAKQRYESGEGLL